MPKNEKVQVIYTDTILRSKSSLKDNTKIQYQHDNIYSDKYFEETCNETCNDETERRMAEHINGDNHYHYIHFNICFPSLHGLGGILRLKTHF